MARLFYYHDETENLVSAEEAKETTLMEMIDETFNLSSDNKSYVGIVTNERVHYKILSDAYNSYSIYRDLDDGKDYHLYDVGDYEKCKKFLKGLFES